MSKAIRGSGEYEKKFRAVIVEETFNSATREELDGLIEKMCGRKEGHQPPLDQCTKYTLMSFALQYYNRFKTRCLPVEYYLLIKLQQGHVKSDYESGECDPGSENKSSPIAELLSELG